MPRHKKEQHKVKNVNWLRAAVLGANDGIVSTASLVLGVVATHASHSSVVLTAVAGLVGGSMSMATGEYVSVSSQYDSEQAALDEERRELKEDDKGEHRELAAMYVRRGLDLTLARQVADQLMARDALDAHAREELGISDLSVAKPLQAAVASACSFAVGAALPLAMVTITPVRLMAPSVAIAALLALAVLGGLAARTGGAKLLPGVFRVTFWSALAMAVTFAIGAVVATLTS
jgi:VIT1/CCC1 family predicted Fe2+/Mn2+ transporter